MLNITIPAKEHFNEFTNEFFSTIEQKLNLEHSLISLSKWESKWKKPYLTVDHKTEEEFIDYVKCMTITKNVDNDIYKILTNENKQKIIDYIDDPMTATTISDISPDKPGSSLSEIVTSELIYYWMVTFNIPFECQKWHLNRLLTLIKICSIKNAAQSSSNKKMSRAEVLNRNRMLNEQRKAQAKTRG